MPTNWVDIPETRGRKTKYQSDYAKQARLACKLGATDKSLAELFSVDVDTINRWKHSQPAFNEALKAGKLDKDSMVVKSLHDRATGYTHKAVKIFCDPKTGAKEVIEYDEHYPPDPTSMIFWLKNRQPKEWRNDNTTVNQVILTGSDIDMVKAIREAAAMLTESHCVETPALPALDIQSDCTSLKTIAATSGDTDPPTRLTD